jgi:N-acetylated-alpha-linked acidic dipeptidase
LSANTAMMAEAKAIGTLSRSGWRPKRTLVYASWDGEEAGLLGSTEWAETHADELRQKGVLYVNSDSNGRGLITFGGSSQFQHLANEAAGSVRDPECGTSVLERLRDAVEVDGFERAPQGVDALHMLNAAKAGEDLPLAPLGSGSDYTPFLQHLGIASIDLGFKGEDADAGIYHSAYDSYAHFIKFGDPKFAYGVAMAETAGRIVLRAGDADIIPMRFGALAAAVEGYVSEIQRLFEFERSQAAEIRRLTAMGAYKAAADPLAPRAGPPDPGDVAPLEFDPLEAAAALLRQSARTYDSAFERAASADFPLSDAQSAALNVILQEMEQQLLNKRGLPERAWYQHMIYAPGVHSGYGAKIHVVAATLRGAAAKLDAAALQLGPRLGAGSAVKVPTPTPPPDA